VVEVKIRLDDSATQKVAGLTNAQVKVAIAKRCCEAQIELNKSQADGGVR
jgi:hypothetical protein